MASPSRHEADRLAFYRRLQERPYAYDFYQVLRRIEALHPGAPRIGDALHPLDEPVRLAQEAALTFAPANLTGFNPGGEGRGRLTVRFLGLFGPQGALPAHITELTRERLRHHNDPTLARFADMFHHRLLSLFYKAWRQAQPAASHDRPDSDHFAAYVDASFGALIKAAAGHAGIESQARRFFSGHLSRGVKNAEGLVAILSGYFQVPVTLQPFHAQWMALPPEQRTALTKGRNNQLGRNIVLGQKVWDAQHHFQLCIGPLTLAQYARLLPGTLGAAKLNDWIRLYTDRQFVWCAQLVVHRHQVPPLRADGMARLGWTTWLPSKSGPSDANGLQLRQDHPARQAATALQEESCQKSAVSPCLAN